MDLDLDVDLGFDLGLELDLDLFFNSDSGFLFSLVFFVFLVLFSLILALGGPFGDQMLDHFGSFGSAWGPSGAHVGLLGGPWSKKRFEGSFGAYPQTFFAATPSKPSCLKAFWREVDTPSPFFIYF